MSYLVLARKWRPRSFDTLVGQEHVVRALTHALTTQRLHHAWLFTGTRGVGKTTLSRILAKSLNCETGITATPCGKCRACTEIDSGRFVDYLELDAASNRGVDEMTQLLEQAVYSPTVGRFKVYMIDEVHMLTGHAFNAMLKTLEEPPAHVKFILATTDPQKIPVTVLSRCLQFNLKQMPPESIVGHLSHVLDAEQMPYETPALRLIGQAARGSMRDALSLTDQAIAFSAGNLTDEAVRSMLGTIDQRHLVRLLDALADGDGAAVLAVADELAIRSLSYSGALGDLAVMLSQIAIAQRVATAAVAEHPLGDDLIRLATRLNPDAVQLFYSIAVHSRAELALAPDEYAGFAMACVRMLAFSAESGGATVPPGTSAIVSAAAKPAALAPAVAVAQAAPASKAIAAPVSETVPASAAIAAPAPATIAASTPETVPTVAADAVLPSESGAAATESVSARVSQATSDSADTASIDKSPPWDETPAPAATPPLPAKPAAAPTAASLTASTEPAPSASQAAADDAPVNSPRAAMARALASGPVSPPPARGASSARAGDAISPARTPAPARAPAPAAAPSRPSRASSGPSDLEPPPWLMDDAEPSFAEPPPGTQGRRDGASSAGGARGGDASVSQGQPKNESRRQPPGQPPSQPLRQAQPGQSSARAQASTPSPARQPAALAESSYGDPRDAEDSGFDDDSFESPASESSFETSATAAPAPAYTGDPGANLVLNEPWPALAARLPVRGIAAQLARQSELLRIEGNLLVLRVSARTLAEGQGAERLRSVLDTHFGRPVRISVEVGATGSDTAHAVEQSVRSARQQAAEEAILADPFVRTLMDNFGGQIVPNSISPVSPELPVKETPK